MTRWLEQQDAAGMLGMDDRTNPADAIAASAVCKLACRSTALPVPRAAVRFWGWSGDGQARCGAARCG
jgi:hypothetical protein